jgi:hypothetical protein
VRVRAGEAVGARAGAGGVAGVLALTVPAEVDGVGRRVDHREELGDAHAQVAVHPVGHHLRRGRRGVR